MDNVFLLLLEDRGCLCTQRVIHLQRGLQSRGLCFESERKLGVTATAKSGKACRTSAGSRYFLQSRFESILQLTAHELSVPVSVRMLVIDHHLKLA